MTDLEKKLERVMEIGVELNYKIKHEDMRVQLFRDVNRHYETNLYRMDNILGLWIEFNKIEREIKFEIMQYRLKYHTLIDSPYMRAYWEDKGDV